MDNQRLRSLTTTIPHTEIGHVYEDLEVIFGEKGLMPHMLPRVLQSIESWLKDNVKDARFWNGKLDVAHTGEFNLPETTPAEKRLFLERFKAIPNRYDYAVLC